MFIFVAATDTSFQCHQNSNSSTK